MSKKVKNLVIVESPAKAKTIEKYLGKDYLVKSSVGHIRDLAKKDMGVDVNNNFLPKYEISADKKQVVSELKKLAKDAEVVWLATDEDREGEAISWHLLEALGVKEEKTRRVVYNQITEKAIQKAIENPKTIDYDLVNAQQARRILDRLVGYELSPVLWKKIRPKLSAGRVQSVSVRLLVEREREISAFKPETYFRLKAHFDVKGETILKAELPEKLKTEEEALEFLESCKDAIYKIDSIKKKPTKRKAAAPFTTSTLQQEASRKLGYSVSQTMSIAQRLYESGMITYMRTDSVNLATEAVNAIEDEVTRSYGKEYAQPRSYATKNKGAQEAHEAIRPTDFSIHRLESGAPGEKLYELIWKRTVASQMADARLEKSTVSIGISGNDRQLKATGEMIVFEGFLKVYMESYDDDGSEKAESNSVLPPLSEGEELILTDMMVNQKFTNHPPRYTEASLVKKLEELGIGRPSTYAPTISTVINRGYVVKEDREGVERKVRVISFEDNKIHASDKIEMAGAERKKLFPTDIGMVVTDFLIENFSKIMDYNFTAKVEEEFDLIASGKKEWQSMLSDFYNPFHENIEYTTEHSERATGERLLGQDPKTGKNVYVRIGRYGPMAQIGESPQNDDDEKPQYSSIRAGQRMEDITLEDALELFKLPRDVGHYEDKKVVIGVGRFGPYVRHDSKFTSIPKEEDPLQITLERSIELIEAKRKADREKFINSFESEDGLIEVLNGRWGPYIKFNKKNFKIPKDVEAKELSMEDCQKIIKENPTKKKTAKKRKAKK